MYGHAYMSSSHVWMWELDYKESWAPKRYFWTVVLEKILESPLDCREIKPVNPKENQFWIFTERTDAEAEIPILWPPDAKNWLMWKDWCWERLKAGGEGNDRIWDGWMTTLIQRTWVWVHSGRWWWTGRSGVLWFMGSQRAGHHWVTELTDWRAAATIRLFTVKESQCLIYIQTKKYLKSKILTEIKRVMIE